MQAENAAELLLDSHDDQDLALIDWPGGDSVQRSVSRGQLRDLAHRAAFDLSERVPPTARIGIVATPTAEFVGSFIGSLLANRSAVIMDRRITPDVCTRSWLELGAQSFFDSELQLRPLVGDMDVEGPVEPTLSEALVLFTSGTSGTGRAVRLSHDNLMHNVEATNQRLHSLEVHLAGDPISLVLSPAHSYGLSIVCLALFSRSPLVCHRYPQLLGSVIAEMNATNVSVLPAVSSQLRLEVEARSTIDQSLVPSLQHRWFAGESLTVNDLVHLHRMREGGTVCQLYGLTEHTARVSIKRVDETFRSEQIGKVLHGVEVEIVDQGPDGIGEITLRSPSVCLGYHNAELRQTPSGYLRTGDLGIVGAADNELLLKGRIRDHVNFKGHSLWIPDVEAEISKIEGVIDCVVTQPTEGAALRCDIVLAEDADEQETIRDIQRRSWPYGVLGTITPVDRISRTLSGKRIRRS